MNLEHFRRLTRWAEKISVALTALSRDLSTELTKAEALCDPLGLCIFQSRASFRVTSSGDNSKSGKRTEQQLQTSFFQARTLGFVGTRGQWDELMRSGRRPETNAAAPPARSSHPHPD